MKYLLIYLLLLCSWASFAQTAKPIPTVVTVPLTSPNQKGTLKIELVQGAITIKAYDGKELIVKTFRQEKETTTSKKGGMTKIANNSFGVEIIEEENEVTIHSNSWKAKADFEIMVPKNFDLHLSTVNNGTIKVEGVEGVIEASNTNGSIHLLGISGAAVANTVNGKVEVTFREVADGMPMAFSSLNGSIDISLPANTKMTAKIKSEYGEIFSDFDMKVREQAMNVEKTEGQKFKKISLDKWVYGDINGGGQEIMLKNMHGDIYIRKR